MAKVRTSDVRWEIRLAVVALLGTAGSGAVHAQPPLFCDDTESTCVYVSDAVSRTDSNHVEATISGYMSGPEDYEYDLCA
jgi:hypothetical protein